MLFNITPLPPSPAYGVHTFAAGISQACGIASGFHPNAKIQYAHKFAAASNVKQGDKGSELPVGTITEWVAGATVTASWSLSVNHGGGYQYRVCPRTGTVDNACFEHNPLAFADGTQTVHFQAKGSKPVTIAAVDVATGVQPAGAAWRRLPIPACACDLGAGCGGTYSGKGNGTASLKNDTTAYGESAAAHGSCTGGLQFEAPHLAKDWPEGYGYYVSELGKAEANPTSCAGAKSEETCGTVEGCKWYGPKTICYAAKAQGGKKRRLEETKKTNTCASHQSETPCTDGEGCTWYGPKNLCYSNSGADATDFSGQDAVVVDGEAQWWISDNLVAPTELGSYVLQWRWDNEQTPQVWTTCADIEVVKNATTTVDNTALTVNNTASSAAATRHGSSSMMSAAAALSAVLAAMLMF